MPKTTVVNIRHQEYDVLCDRTTIWGNPFRIGTYGRLGAIAKYREWFLAHPELVARAKRELRGKRLGCHCVPLACHVQVIANVIDAEE